MLPVIFIFIILSQSYANYRIILIKDLRIQNIKFSLCFCKLLDIITNSHRSNTDIMQIFVSNSISKHFCFVLGDHTVVNMRSRAQIMVNTS